MDVLVRWRDGSKNVVSSAELKTVKCNLISVGCTVKMSYKKRWYYGTVLAVEMIEFDSEEPSFDSEDEIPLAKLKELQNASQSADRNNGDFDTSNNVIEQDSISSNSPIDIVQVNNVIELRDNRSYDTYQISNRSFSPIDDSDADPTVTCEVVTCGSEVFSSCPNCQILLCFKHFDEDLRSCNHGRKHMEIRLSVESDRSVLHEETQNYINGNTANEQSMPESFILDGEDREGEIKPRKTNKQRVAKLLRNCGQEYISPNTKKSVPARFMRNRCNSETCKVYGKNCFKIDDEQRHKVFNNFNSSGDLQLQREFLTRHLEVRRTKRTTTNKENFRRKHTIIYKLTVDKEAVVVCKKLFLNTLGITEKMCRTALSKINEVGVLEKDNRGGRQRSAEIQLKERNVTDAIEQHIQRFPRVESHYCRSKTTRMYLHPDLSLRKMYAMYLDELERQGQVENKASYSLYRKIFKRKNLSFLSPKKDQCSLCVTYCKGDENTKNSLKDRYDTHIQEKTTVRQIKTECKKEAQENNFMLCGVVDLQQVIYLPISKESAIFYKSRLSNFNFTFYDIANKECFCFVWHEAISKRGFSEIATCIYRVLEEYNKRAIRSVALFADGCFGQNKNSIIPAMLMYSLSKLSSLEKISLRYFETNHGQSEGDSAHSATSSAISAAGDLYIPPQLHPIIRLACRKQPYCVVPMSYGDFKDFKSFSKKLRILTIRETERGNVMKWPDVMEVMVTKRHPKKIFFKTSHLDTAYDSITLKRLKDDISDIQLNTLNLEAPKIKKRKYEDLMSLCKGETPVVRLPEFQEFFRSLPHDQE